MTFSKCLCCQNQYLCSTESRETLHLRSFLVDLRQITAKRRHFGPWSERGQTRSGSPPDAVLVINMSDERLSLNCKKKTKKKLTKVEKSQNLLHHDDLVFCVDSALSSSFFTVCCWNFHPQMLLSLGAHKHTHVISKKIRFIISRVYSCASTFVCSRFRHIIRVRKVNEGASCLSTSRRICLIFSVIMFPSDAWSHFMLPVCEVAAPPSCKHILRLTFKHSQ